MQIDVPFYHRATVRRQGKRKHVGAVYRSSVPVEVPEPTPDEAPVVLRIPHASFVEPRQVDVRLFDGRLFMAYEPSDGSGQPGRARDAAWLLERNARPRRGINPLGAGCDGGRDSDLGVGQDPTVAAVISTEADEVASEILGKARGLALIEGHVWREVAEPRLEISVSNGGHKVYAQVERGDHPRRPADTFRLDEVDLLLATCRERYGEHCEVDLPPFEVLDPGCLALDTAAPALREAGKNLLKQMRGAIGDEGVAYFVAYAALRDAMATLPAEGPVPPEATDALAAALRAGAETDDDPDFEIAEALHRHERQRGDYGMLAGLAA